jgi:hypothetical protein
MLYSRGYGFFFVLSLYWTIRIFLDVLLCSWMSIPTFRTYDHSKRREVLAQHHIVTLQNIGPSINAAVSPLILVSPHWLHVSFFHFSVDSLIFSSTSAPEVMRKSPISFRLSQITLRLFCPSAPLPLFPLPFHSSLRTLPVSLFVRIIIVCSVFSSTCHSLQPAFNALGWNGVLFPKIRFQRDVWGTYTRDALCTPFSLLFKFPFAFGLHLSFSFTSSVL